jgi:hypothetical protein
LNGAISEKLGADIVSSLRGVNRPWRKVKITERRATEDYVQCMRELVDAHYLDAACIRVVNRRTILDPTVSRAINHLGRRSAFKPHAE